eukprot:265825_1
MCVKIGFKLEKISIIHTSIDIVGLAYIIAWKQQIIIAWLIFLVIVLNIWQACGSFIRKNVHGIKQFSVDLFHASFQLLPFAISLSYYDSNDVFINTLFIIICISFVKIIYVDSKKINSHDDNNTRIHQIFCLCIILDYINGLVMLLCKLYTTNNYYFYKFFLSSYPFCFGLTLAICNWEHKNWIQIIRNFDSNTFRKFFVGLWYLFILAVLYPVGMEIINASWIIFVYFEFATKMRHSKKFNEKLKDELVEWLNQNKDDLLIKICIINHFELITESNFSDKLCVYLDTHCENNKFYKYVTWSAFKNNSRKFKEMNLTKKIVQDVISFCKFRVIWNQVRQRYHGFRQYMSVRTFIQFVERVWEFGSAILLFYYSMNCILNVFFWPVVSVFVMYDVVNIHQALFMGLYWLILSVVFYKLYVMLNYERMMWYVESDFGRRKQIDTGKYTEYYKYIKEDFWEIKSILGEVLGNDIANIVLLYVPDFITEHRTQCQYKI